MITPLRNQNDATVLSAINLLFDWVLDGTEAWHYLENQWTQYTLGIFDWLLAGLSGLELCLESKQPPASLDANSQRPDGR